MKPKTLAGILVLALLAAAASSCIRFHAKPLQPAKILEDFEARRLTASELRDFLLANGEAKDWPPAAWDLRSLTLAALYFHPDMDVARAQWGVAQGGRITAGERPNPVLNPLVGYNATTPRSEVTPWIPEIALEITIETAGKRGLRIAEARHLSDAARWSILKTAWDVRSRLRGALLEAYAAAEMGALLAEAEGIQSKIVDLLEVQRSAGEVSAFEVAQARIALDQSRLAAVEAARAKEEAMARLAAAVGVPRAALEGIALSYGSLGNVPSEFPAGEVRRHAVLNRSDILAALSEYAASESALHLEIAKQYPDLHLGPDYQLDQTDSKWTLGLAVDLPILSRNRGPIAEAEARRRETAASFLALQAGVIGELDAAIEDCRAAAGKSEAAERLRTDLATQAKAARARRDLGEISTLDLLAVELELNAAAQARLEALTQAQEAVGRLENAAQSPLDVKDWIYSKSPGTPGPGKEPEHD